MASIVICNVPLNKKDRFFVVYRKERLSGPWSTHEQAVVSRGEWIVPKFGGFVKREK
jgi:hypothetical protein